MRPESGGNAQESKDNPHHGGKGKPNRLIHEKSPYLLQHAYNPVDWYPWGDEAFEKARAENKPIFLSIGYSTCHWCHVMERESFEDPEVARRMNEAWISIKVDREERPDIDHLYMSVCQMMTGGGGWPLNVVMTPDRKPFFAGTYFPKETRFGRIGMLDLTTRITEVWKTRQEEVLQTANRVLTALRQTPEGSGGRSPGTELLNEAFDQLSKRFDPKYGGFNQAPKFPTPHNLFFLLRFWKRTGEAKALEMVEKTLQQMRMGGIYDHVGLGFHRYSTDAQWLLPHFEKMLYDQAMLAMAYTEAFQATGKTEYAETAKEIFTYVLRDMTSPNGGFYSAEDADSEGEEGKFYVWTNEEIGQVLGPEDAELITRIFTVRPEGNFHDEATGQITGKNILHTTKRLSELASELSISESDLVARIETARKKLFDTREQRIHPYKDDKILTDWNGLMIAALAKGAQALKEPSYLKAAQKAAEFILSTLRDQQGRLLHRFRDGEAGLPAHVDDYAFFIWGLLELYEAGFDTRYLNIALELHKDFEARFWDSDHGGFFFTAEDQHELLVRNKESYDGAVPAGNSVAALNMLRLGRITGNPELERKADMIGSVFSANIRQIPSAYTQLLSAYEFALGPSYEIVVVGEPDSPDTLEMLTRLRVGFFPNKVVLFRPASTKEPEISRIAEFTKFHSSKEGKATAYVCKNYECQFPTTDPNKMIEMLAGKKE